MTRFADQLLADLLSDHGSALRDMAAPAARRRGNRPLWVSAGALGAAGATAAGLALVAGGSPAYAVTENGDGSLTITINRLSGVEKVNTALHSLGVAVVAVPVRTGCPSITSLPRATLADHGSLTVDAADGANNGDAISTITLNVHGIPAGDTALVAYSASPDGRLQAATSLIAGPAPACVSIPPALTRGSAPDAGQHAPTASLR